MLIQRESTQLLISQIHPYASHKRLVLAQPGQSKAHDILNAGSLAPGYVPVVPLAHPAGAWCAMHMVGHLPKDAPVCAALNSVCVTLKVRLCNMQHEGWKNGLRKPQAKEDAAFEGNPSCCTNGLSVLHKRPEEPLPTV